MNKACARCQKVVYPIEELKCLDKTWHKTCFKCTECGMTLNMKTYKGFNKLPYCEAHIPKAKATTIAETPELKRIAENTKIQSNVKYHADFEKAKGKFTQVADDPETLRIKQNTKNISNVAYHGDLQKKAAMERQRECTEIIDSKDNNELESEYFSEQLAAESLPHYQPPPPPPVVAPASHHQQQQQQQQHSLAQQQLQASMTGSSSSLSSLMGPNGGAASANPTAAVSQQAQITPTSTLTKHNLSSLNQQQQNNYQASQHQQQMAYQQQVANNNYSKSAYPAGAPPQTYQQPPPPNHYHHNSNSSSNSSTHASDNVRQTVLQNSATPSGLGNNQKYYDPYDNYARPNPNAAMVNNNNNYNSHYHQHQQQQQQQQPGGGGGGEQRSNGSAAYHHAQQQHHGHAQHHQQGDGGYGHPQQQQQQQQQRYNGQQQYAQQQQQYQYNNGNVSNGGGGAGGIGKIADYDPLTDGPRNIPQPNRQSQTLIFSSGNLNANNNRRYIQPPQQYGAPTSTPAAKPMGKVRVYRAIYDYEAQDSDEVGFTEGDLIIEVNSIDSGWMTGRVERTGLTGMLPANYVELVKI
ncbi:hypothetical protein pipiens_001854 [Culex pipiens pipiens]|uniref:Nebulin repeat protein n=1 Tax=Culex pipiens pipiens TaxID=38569 RepID=A0ABD1DRP9_CULPP